MTDITDEQVAEWAKEASKHALIKWFAKAAKESPGFFRRFAELAQQEEREACARVCDELGEMNKLAPTDSAWQWGECAAAIRSRTTRS
jgi:hypothetical protein